MVASLELGQSMRVHLAFLWGAVRLNLAVFKKITKIYIVKPIYPNIMTIENLPLSIIINIIAIVYPGMRALRERHFTPRNQAVINGLILIGTGISLIIFNPALWLFKIPLAAFPIIHGIAGIVLTVSRTRTDLGTKVCSSLATTIMLIAVLLVQFGIVKL